PRRPPTRALSPGTTLFRSPPLVLADAAPRALTVEHPRHLLDVQRGGEHVVCADQARLHGLLTPAASAITAHVDESGVTQHGCRLLDPIGGHVLGAHRFSPRCSRMSAVSCAPQPLSSSHWRAAAGPITTSGRTSVTSASS